MAKRKYDEEGREWRRIEYGLNPFRKSERPLWSKERRVLSFFEKGEYLDEEAIISMGLVEDMSEGEVLKNLDGLVDKGYLMKVWKSY